MPEQIIKLLTPKSDFVYLEVKRDPKWNESGSTLSDDDAILRYTPDGEFETLGNAQLTLWVEAREEYGMPVWFFSLNHRSFWHCSLYEWEFNVPDESLSDLLPVECNELRETRARVIHDKLPRKYFGEELDP